jgi:nucleoid-associated protein
MKPRRHGSNLNVKGMVIHQLKKTAGFSIVGYKKAKEVLVVSDKEKLFLGRLNESYHKKSNPTYGIFGDGNPTFKNQLKQYLADDNFYQFSISASTQYKNILENTINATGGFLIFIDFFNSDNSHRYMLILTINNKDGYVVREHDLTIEDIKNIDLSKVDVACMINLSAWESIENGINTESKTYLSFVRGNKGVSNYFMSFIDCDNKTTNTESTKRLTRAIDEYVKEKGYDRKTKIKIRNIAYDYCTSCMKQKKEILLSALSALVDPDSVTDFQEFASDEEYGVSETIRGDSTQLRRIKFIKYKDEKYTVEFDSDLIGKDIFYNKQKNELTFKRVPEELASQIPS